jgi:hypothetical protein
MAAPRRELWEIKEALGEAEEVRGFLVHGIAVGDGIWRYGSTLPRVSVPSGMLAVDDEARRRVIAAGVPQWGAGVHQIPWGFAGMVAVENDMREVLEQLALPDTIRFERLPVIE